MIKSIVFSIVPKMLSSRQRSEISDAQSLTEKGKVGKFLPVTSDLDIYQPGLLPTTGTHKWQVSTGDAPPLGRASSSQESILERTGLDARITRTIELDVTPQRTDSDSSVEV